MLVPKENFTLNCLSLLTNYVMYGMADVFFAIKVLFLQVKVHTKVIIFFGENN